MCVADFKYEFDFFKLDSDYEFNDSYYPFIGYVSLNQYVKQDLFSLSNKELIEEFQKTLESGEIISEHENEFILTLNSADDRIVEYVKLFLQCYLIVYSDFIVDNNKISFKRLFDED